MKKLLPILSIALVMAACNTSPKAISDDQAASAMQQPVQVITPDTTGLASYNAWKAENELAPANEYLLAKQNVAKTPQAIKKTKQKTVTPVPTNTTSTSAGGDATSGNAGSNDTNNSEGGTINTESTETAKAEKKEGVSKAVKGAVIGGVTGGAAGAVINKKNRVVGAVIGAVIGAGGGYVIGRKMDKKDGR